MKKQDIRELHTKTIEELKRQLIDIRAVILSTKMSFAQRKEVNTAQKKKLRHDIARILTELRLKEGRTYGKKNI